MIRPQGRRMGQKRGSAVPGTEEERTDVPGGVVSRMRRAQ